MRLFHGLDTRPPVLDFALGLQRAERVEHAPVAQGLSGNAMQLRQVENIDTQTSPGGIGVGAHRGVREVLRAPRIPAASELGSNEHAVRRRFRPEPA